MAASADSVTLGKSTPIEGWTVVVNRRNKRNKDLSKSRKPNPQEAPPVPVDLEVDPERESRLLQKMMLYIKKVESSDFYSTFIYQIRSPEVQNSILRDSSDGESKRQMVIYGIGSIESYESPRLQLSLAILMKKSFDWIGDVEVFDPIISLTEYRVMTSLGFSVLSVNEEGRREAMKKVLFFMPHCDSDLYDNLLETNWSVEKLKNIIILGNSFEKYEQHALLMRSLDTLNSRKHILAAMKFMKEVKINSVLDAFHDLSWHSFDIDDSQIELLQSVDKVHSLL